MNSSIKIKGARVNNLKNIDVEIPRNKLVVVTGLSGSGKSSLAFDTLYAEGQRRYVESLSSYARQFLGRMGKPECDFIKGIPPAIAIEQKVTSRNPRSTVGTSTEIYDFLRLLYARIGKTISPVSGTEVKKHTSEDVLEAILKYPKDTKFTILTPFNIPEGRSIETQLEVSLKQGFSRIDIDGEIIPIEDFLKEKKFDGERKMFILVDRMKVDDAKDVVSRMADSVETAFYEGNGTCYIRIYPEKELLEFSNKFEADGIAFEEPTDQTFSFNSPLGACPECEGFGKIIGIDPALVIPNSALSVYEGAVVCWRGEKMVEWKSREGELPYLQAILSAFRPRARLALARTARRGEAAGIRAREHRQLLQDAARKPVQDSVPRDAFEIQRQDRLSCMPRKKAEERNRIHKSRRQVDNGTCRAADNRFCRILQQS